MSDRTDALELDKAAKAKQMRYKKPALQMLARELIFSELEEIREKCADITYYTSDEETLLNALDGEEEEAFEFKIAFCDLEQKADRIYEALRETYVTEYFDDFMVGILGNKYRMIGYDDYEEDYFSLVSYEERAAFSEAGKRIMRLTKEKMISVSGQCMGIFVAMLDIRQKYDSLKATFDILLGENTSLLNQVKEIEALYEEAMTERNGGKKTRQLDSLVSLLPDTVWIG
jgi:hypothetical protein